ncbi:MAG: hypothetical protein KBG19_06750 [Bacteroidales bacterium]|nr:hypothetical protein [Bacteroidales bacterium]
MFAIKIPNHIKIANYEVTFMLKYNPNKNLFMSEESKKTGIVSSGKPEVGNFIMPDDSSFEAGDEGGAGDEGAGDEGAGNDGAGNQGGDEGAGNQGAGNQGGDEGAGDSDDLPSLSDDQLKKILGKRGISLEGDIADLAKKLSGTPGQQDDETDEQKQAKAAAFEKRMLDNFIENGGTAESFVAIKQIASTDLRQLAEYDIRKEMKEGGFSDEEINAVLTERYYQVNPEELEKGEGESEEDFNSRKEALKKKVAYGTKQLEKRGETIKKQSERALTELRKAIELKDTIGSKEAEFSSKVDEVVSNLPKKMTFQLGKIEDVDIAPVEFVPSNDDIAHVSEILKDVEKRNQFFYKDNQLNVENIANVMLRNKVLESAIKAVFLEGGNRQVAEFEKIFPGRSASDVGAGGAPKGHDKGRKGVIVSAGKPEVGVLKPHD